MAFDVTVIGLGVMGSAAAWQLARRGLRVLGLEQFTPAHDRGSSHGLTRVIRQAYFEDPAYVPLVLRAYDLWEELERETGRQLLKKMPALMIGRAESIVVRGSLESAHKHRLSHRLLSTADLRMRFPFMNFLEGEVAVEEFFVWERDGRVFYSIPDVGDHGVKAAFHHGGRITTPESVQRQVGQAEIDEMRAMLVTTVPTLNGTLKRAATCLYTNTPDGHFAIGFLPDNPRTLVVSPCSGHGFKFAPVVGEIVADLVIDGRTAHPIELFRLDKFTC